MAEEGAFSLVELGSDSKPCLDACIAGRVDNGLEGPSGLASPMPRPAPMQGHRRTARQVSPSTISRTPTPSTTTSRSFLNTPSRIPPR